MIRIINPRGGGGGRGGARMGGRGPGMAGFRPGIGSVPVGGRGAAFVGGRGRPGGGGGRPGGGGGRPGHHRPGRHRPWRPGTIVIGGGGWGWPGNYGGWCDPYNVYSPYWCGNLYPTYPYARGFFGY